MGCDIHFYVERRVNGKWVTADKWITDEDGSHVSYDHQYYSGRNYDLFAILANVRNGRGFAGIKTGDGFAPISEPRGVPEDTCSEYLAAIESYGSDGHSHSYITVREIMEYDWTQTTRKQGWVTRREYARFKVNGSPDTWSGGVSGPGVAHLSNEEMEKLDRKDGRYTPWLMYHSTAASDVYTFVSWEVPYYRAVGSFLSETVPQLWRLGSPDDVRCVFFFDN